jgi:large subunit ribosomal protein L15
VPDGLNLSTLKPAQQRQDRKRIGRGQGSGKGRYSGRGLKGQKSRAGSHKMRAGFEGGQMPIYMRLGKLRGSTSKDAMPIGPHRTKTWAVNVSALERFDGEVTPEALAAAGLIRNTRFDVKILGQGELTKKLTVSAHNFSKSARDKIEGAGGSIVWLRGEPKPKIKKRRAAKPVAAEEELEVEEAPAAEEEPEAPSEEPAE